MEPLALMFVQEAERRMLESSGYGSERPALFPDSLPSGSRGPAPRSRPAVRPSRTRTATASALRRVADVVDPGLAPRAPRRAGA
jgi:hypothetical protein